LATEEDEADAADADAELAPEEAAAEVMEAEADETAADEEEAEPPELPLLTAVAFRVPHTSLVLHVVWPSASLG